MTEIHPRAIDEFKNEYGLEFLGLPDDHSEADLHITRSGTNGTLSAASIAIDRGAAVEDLRHGADRARHRDVFGPPGGLEQVLPPVVEPEPPATIGAVQIAEEARLQ
jgi:hypothetical protein